jgi:hypothetical protein
MSLHYAAIVIFAVVFSSAVDACSMPLGWRPRSPVEQLLDARDVLLATVLRTIPDDRFGYGSSTSAYTAEVSVHCILKGRRCDSIVNITQAGMINVGTTACVATSELHWRYRFGRNSFSLAALAAF